MDFTYGGALAVSSQRLCKGSVTMQNLGPRSHTSFLPRRYVFDPIPVLTILSHLVRSEDLQVAEGMQMLRPAFFRSFSQEGGSRSELVGIFCLLMPTWHTVRGRS